MRASLLILVCALAVVGPATVLAKQTCPPKGFKSVQGLDLRKYAAAPWYVQQQMPVSYQPVSSLYCVRAYYRFNDTSDPRKGIFVYNTAKNGSVNGPDNATGKNVMALVAFPDESAFDPKNPFIVSKLKVGPSFLAPQYQQLKNNERAFGPYWVVAVQGDGKGGYKWAIVSGGPPKNPSNGACSTDMTMGQGGTGLWLFHRQPVAPAADVQAMRKKATTLGFDLSVLQTVQQQGCRYPPLPTK